MLKRLSMVLAATAVMGVSLAMMPRKVEAANLRVTAVHSIHKWEKGKVSQCGSSWKNFKLWGSSGGQTFWGIPRGWHTAYALMDCGGYNSGSINLPSKYSWREKKLYP
jgi:hypothetical protein